jgi:hypothetical protein
VPIVLESGIFNQLEHSEPVQACNGIALSLPLPLVGKNYDKPPVLCEKFKVFVSRNKGQVLKLFVDFAHSS